MTFLIFRLLRFFGAANPYPGTIGMVREGAYANMLPADGDPLKNPELVTNPDKNFVMIMKDGVVYKNTLAAR